MKQKQYVSRRQRVIRRLVALLVLAVLFMVSGIFKLFPGQAMRAAEISVDCGRTTVLRKLGSAKIRYDGLNRMYLSVNSKALLFVPVQFLPLEGGWQAYPGAVDCTKDRPLHAGIYMAGSEWQVTSDTSQMEWEEYSEYLQNSYRFERVYYAYGRIDDPSAALVRILVGYEGEEGWVTLRSEDIPRDKWIRSEGRIYFVEEIYRGSWIVEDSDYEGRVSYRAELLDEERNVLYLDEELVSGACRLSPVPVPEEPEK